MILHKRQIAHVRRLTVEASQVVEASCPAGPGGPPGRARFARRPRRMPRRSGRPAHAPARKQGRGPQGPPGEAEGGLAAPRHARVAGAAPYPPTACAAVLSAMAGLTAEFGMGSGDPCLHGRAHKGRSSVVKGCPRHPGGRMASHPAISQATLDPTNLGRCGVKSSGY